MAIQISFGVQLGAWPHRGAAALDTPLPDHAATLVEFGRDLATFDSGAALTPAENRATLPVSGGSDAPDGAVIEGRLVAFHDKTDVEMPAESTGWADVATIGSGDGSWSGTVSGPRNVGTEYRVEVRVKGSAAPAARMTRRCRIGHVWAIWEQSNGSRLFNAVSNGSLYEPLVSENDVFVIARQTQVSGDGTNAADYEMRPVNSTTAVADTPAISPAVVAMANAFSSARPGEKLLIVAQTEQGTHPVEALTTTSETAAGTYAGARAGGRDWLIDRAIHDAATAGGTQVGAVFVPGWWEAIGTIPAVLGTHARVFLGKDFATGAKQSLATIDLPRLYLNTYPDGSNTDADGFDLRTAFDPDGDANPKTGGIYDMTYTRWAFFGPHEANKRVAQVPAAAEITGISDIRFDTAGDLTYDTLVTQARETWTGANAAFPEALPYVGVTHGTERSTSDDVHITAGTADGRQRLAKLWMFNMLKATGLTDVPTPVLDMRFTAPDGSYADFGIAGRDVTTERLRRGLAPIAQIGATGGNQDTATGANTPHRTEVMGWSINGQAAGRTEIHTVTAGDVSAGHPGTEGQTVCRVYAPTATTFGPSDVILYGQGSFPAISVEEDYDDGAFLNLLVADMGQPAALIPALPVQVHTMGMPALDLAVPDVFDTQGTAKFRTNDAAIIGAVNTAYFDIRFRPDSLAGSQPTRIVAFGNDANVTIETDGSVILTDGTNSATLAAGSVAVGAFIRLRFLVDRATGVMEIQDETGTTLDSAVTATGNFASGRLQFFGAASAPPATLDATVEYALAYLGATDNSGPATHGFVGDGAAAAVAGLAEAGAATVFGAAELRTFGGGTVVAPGA